MYKEAELELKAKIPNPNENDSEYRLMYSIVKTRASKFVDPSTGRVGNTYLIPFFDLIFLTIKKELVRVKVKEEKKE